VIFGLKIYHLATLLRRTVFSRRYSSSSLFSDYIKQKIEFENFRSAEYETEEGMENRYWNGALKQGCQMAYFSDQKSQFE
jgi:hypothetical protein